MPIGRTWAMATAGKNASSAVRPGRPDAEGLGGGDRRQHQHELVGEADEQHVGRGGRLVLHPVQPEVDGAREPAPAVLGLEAPADALVGDGVQEDAQRHQRGERHAERHLGGPAEVAERRVHQEADHADQAGARASP